MCIYMRYTCTQSVKIKMEKQKYNTYMKIMIPRKREKQECRQKQNEKKCLKYKNDIHNIH